MVLSKATPTLGAALTLMLALSLFYVAGMYFNDAFDAEFDRQHRPNRPIPSGAISTLSVFSIGTALLGGGLALLLVNGFVAPGGTGWRGFEAGLALSAAILLYDAWHKGNPIGPVLMGLCRVLVYVTAAVAVADALPKPLLTAAEMALSYLVGLTYAAKQEDFAQPRNLWPLLFLGAPFVYGLPIAAEGGAGLLIYVIFLAAVVYALSFMVRPGRRNIPRVVTVLIAGICLLDGLFIAGQGQAALAALTIAAFVLTLLLQRYIAGT
jgi:hypothetical protein